MDSKHFDLIVIGSGPAGQRAAVQAAKLGKKVLVAEKSAIGGSCLHTGTIPSKTLREAALKFESQKHGELLNRVMRQKDQVIDSESQVFRNQLERNKITFKIGAATFVDSHTVQIASDQDRYSFDYAVIATGTRPHRDDKISFDDQTIFDSDTILRLKKFPETLAVVGAGVIGCEYASIFAKLGAKVTLIDRRATLLRDVDEEILKNLLEHFDENHIRLQLGADIGNITTKSPGVALTISGQETIFDSLLYCMGRDGNTAELNLKAAGLEANQRGLIEVNEFYQTKVSHIYAAGDIIGFPALAAASAEQGRLASAHAFKRNPAKFSNSFPFGIYTIPEISWTGSSERELTEKNRAFIVGKASYKELARGRIIGDDHGLLKLIFCRETQKLLGVHIIGTGATELVHIGQVALRLGANISFFVENVFNYPTLAEAYKVAALAAFNQIQTSGDLQHAPTL